MSALALTFDDGPDARTTPALLDRLGELEATATFFPIATRAAAAPELIARMLEQGHTVGLHCDQHVRHSDREIDWLRSDVATACERLHELGVTPRLWRTPWGDLAPWSDEVAAEHDLRIVGWSVDTEDWRGDTAEQMFMTIHEALVPGAVVLAHDGIGPGAPRADAGETVRLTSMIGALGRARGWSLEALR